MCLWPKFWRILELVGTGAPQPQQAAGNPGSRAMQTTYSPGFGYSLNLQIGLCAQQWRLIYTTSVIELLNMNPGKVSMSRSLFPSDEALLKLFNIERYKTLAEN